MPKMGKKFGGSGKAKMGKKLGGSGGASMRTGGISIKGQWGTPASGVQRRGIRVGQQPY